MGEYVCRYTNILTTKYKTTVKTNPAVMVPEIVSSGFPIFDLHCMFDVFKHGRFSVMREIP